MLLLRLEHCGAHFLISRPEFFGALLGVGHWCKTKGRQVACRIETPILFVSIDVFPIRPLYHWYWIFVVSIGPSLPISYYDQTWWHAYFELILITDKSDHLIQSNLACILISLGRFEEGFLRANKTCQLQPTWPKASAVLTLRCTHSLTLRDQRFITVTTTRATCHEDFQVQTMNCCGVATFFAFSTDIWLYDCWIGEIWWKTIAERGENFLCPANNLMFILAVSRRQREALVN